MTTLTTWLIAAGGALVAVILAVMKAWFSGAKASQDAARAKEADAYEKHLQEIADAARARNAVRPDIVPDDDKYRRD